MTIAVTGASGYLGSRFAVDLGMADARALVRVAAPWLAVPQVEIDVLDPVEHLVKALDGADVVIHLAGHNEVVAREDPDRAIAETVVGTRHVVEAATLAGVRRVVYVSTVHVYGDRLAPGATIDEEVAPAPRSAYSIARLASEHLVMGGPSPVVLRLTNAVGPPVHPEVNRWTLVAADLCRTVTATGELVLHSTGQQCRDFIALDDVARICLATLDPEAVAPGTYNLASGVSMTVRALATLVQDRVELRTGVRPPLRAPAPEGPDPEPYRIDTSRLDALGLRAVTPIATAIDGLLDACARAAVTQP